MGKSERAEVVIVGGGPVGIGLAIELGRRGISCTVVERRAGMHNIPKGQNLTPRTMEHFHFWGVCDAVRAKRIIPKGLSAGGITGYRSLASEHWFRIPGREVTNRYYFQGNERLPQYLMEEVLRQRVAAFPCVSVRYGWAATAVSQDDAGVRVSIAEEGGSGRETLEAAYAVGCDGGHSTVREAIGIARGGKDYDQLMVLAVLRSRELNEAFKRFPECSTYRALTPDLKGYWQFFGRVDADESWFFHSPIPNDVDRRTYNAHGLIEQVAGFKFKAEYDHIGFWDMRVAVAERYQVGRVFIAGDAAHSHPPYGGYGVNNGLEDAVNLGWKLAARLQGWGSDALIASYSEERRPVFKETAEDFIGARTAYETDILERFSPEKDREAFVRAWAGMADDGANRIQTYAPHYEGSAVVHGPQGGVCSAHGTHTFQARAGHHLPPLRLTSGANVFERLGQGFTLVALGVEDATVDQFLMVARDLDIPFQAIRDSFEGERLQYGERLILVRPDQYVVWTGDEAPPGARRVLAKAVGR